MNIFLVWFVKLTGYPLHLFYYHKKVYFEKNNKSLRKINGPAIIISNHTAVMDFPLIMYTFFCRNIRPLVAEVIFEISRFMGNFTKAMGGIIVDRNSFDFSFMEKSVAALKKNHVILIFPESKLPTDPDSREFLEFKASYVYIALESGAPIIPVYTNGSYGKLRRKRHENAKIMVGERIYAENLLDSSKSDRENIDFINNYVKNYIYGLRDELENREK